MLRFPMDRIDLFRVFVRVVDGANLSRAAVSLGLPRSSVSAAIKELEGRLGTRLLHRNTRRLSLTPDGAALYERCRPLLAEAEEIENLFRAGHRGVAGRVRLDVPSRIGRRILAPALPALLERHPDLAIDLGMTDRAIDLIAEGVDCIVRAGTPAAPSLQCRPLGELTLITIASPDYLSRHGTPHTPDDLDCHLAVGYDLTAGTRANDWSWQEAGQTRTRTLASRVGVNNVEGYIACCLAGLGLIQVPAYDVRDHLDNGELREILADWRPAPMPLSLLTAPLERLPMRLEIVIDWLTAVLGDAIGMTTAGTTATGQITAGTTGASLIPERKHPKHLNRH